MISDTLADAVAQIRDYLLRQPDVYASKREKIDSMVNAMDDLRCELDGWLPIDLIAEANAEGERACDRADRKTRKS